MQVGISTASLFKRFTTEKALKFLSENGVKTAEVFLESFCEYNKRFGKKLSKLKGKTKINSIHTLTTQFEPQLFSDNKIAQNDSFKILNGVLDAGKALGAEKYTFHGAAVFKKVSSKLNLDSHAENTQKVIDLCKQKGITLAYENVQWGFMNYIGFFTEMRKRTNGLKATLDIKQARRSDISPFDLVKEIGEDIVTVHLSDITENGKMCLPLSEKGTFDFYKLFSMLKDYGFKGSFIIEAYYSDYENISELFESYSKLNELCSKIF